MFDHPSSLSADNEHARFFLSKPSIMGSMDSGTVDAFMRSESASVFDDPGTQAVYAACLEVVKVVLTKACVSKDLGESLGIQSSLLPCPIDDVFDALALLAKSDGDRLEEGVGKDFPIDKDAAVYYAQALDTIEAAGESMRGPYQSLSFCCIMCCA